VPGTHPNLAPRPLTRDTFSLAARRAAGPRSGEPALGPGSKPVSLLLTALWAAACESPAAMTKDEERELRGQLTRLQQEHRDLDAAISALQHSPGSDLLQVQRLKKRKLHLRDRIAHLEDLLTPDIIA